MQAAIARDSVLRELLDKCNAKTTFADGWKVLSGQFLLVERFCGGLATVFPGTSQVESDFSLVKGAKDVFKQSMTDLSLEGILHAKQMEMIKSYS